MAHVELGVEAVRAHAILNDDLGTYREVDGRPVHDFTGIDRIYDHVMGLGLRPIVELSFMPRDLAVDPSKTVFDYGAIVSPPKDWDRWEALVHDLTAHLVDRYGLEEVRRWAFEVWNEANLDVFWSGTREEYLRLYDVSVRAVKAVDAAADRGRAGLGGGQVGGRAAGALPGDGRRRSTSSRHTPTATRRSTSARSRRATASRAFRSGGPSGARTPATSTPCTTRRGAPPTWCAAWRPRWDAPRPSPTGRSPTTSRSSAVRRGSCTAASGCWPSAICASRAGGACGCSSSSSRERLATDRRRRRRRRHGPGHRLARR